MKILLLEDDIMLGESIKKYIQSTGHIVRYVRDGYRAFDLAKTEKFDLLILDINVPGIDGLSLLEMIQINKIKVPSIYISALVDIAEISKAFSMGCFDYLKKPFHLKELSLRINKILQIRQVHQSHKRLSNSYSFDSDSYTLMYNNKPQRLPQRQLQIIEYLSQNRSRVVNYDMFRDNVWKDDMIDNATIRAEVNRVKKVLKEDFIKNIRSIGYMIERPI